MEIKEAIAGLFRREPSIEDLYWEAVCRIINGAGGVDLVKQLAAELKEKGDGTVIVQESTRNFSPYCKLLTLFWDLGRPEAAASGWQSKGVRIAAFRKGNVDVYHTYGQGWRNIEGAGSNLPKDLREMSLTEKVKLAMTLAEHSPDFRYGERDDSWCGHLVSSKTSRRIF